MATVRAADTSEAVGKVAALEIIVDDLGDNWAEETVVLDESFVIDLREPRNDQLQGNNAFFCGNNIRHFQNIEGLRITSWI